MKARKTFSEIVIWILMITLLILGYLGRVIAPGYVAQILLPPIVGILLLYLVRNSFKVRIKISYYNVWMFLFSFYALMSGLWAIKSQVAFSRGFILLEISIIMFLITQCLQQNFSVDSLLKILMFTGYIIDCYVVLSYGVDAIINMLMRSYRISNDAINANTLGILTAYAIIINIYFILYCKKKTWSIFLFPAIMILIISGCRTGLIGAIFGIILLFFFKSLSNQNILSRIIKIAAVSLSLLLIFIFAYNSPIFSTFRERMQGLTNGIFGIGKADLGATTRLAMIGLGIRIFSQYPFLGVGMQNAEVVYGMFNSKEMYLHNNYIELLADGGIIGFILFYAMFVYLLYQYFTYRELCDGEYAIGLVMLVMRLLMDIGTVSYLECGEYFFVFLSFWIIQKVKKRKTSGFMNGTKV